VEAKLVYEIGSTIVVPAAVRYQTEVALNIGALKGAGVDADVAPLADVTEPIVALRAALGTLKAALAHEADSAVDEAVQAKDVLLPAMAGVRAAADELEGIVADDLWPLPTYQEMLFIL
jgi:glutamine synthetase